MKSLIWVFLIWNELISSRMTGHEIVEPSFRSLNCFSYEKK